jgi:hypothetical protein
MEVRLQAYAFLSGASRLKLACRGYQEQETVRSAFDAEEVAAKCADYRKQLASLEEESLALDEAIATISSRISGMLRDPEVKEYAYLHQSELQELPCVRDRVAVAIEYPMDSTLHFTMPATGTRYLVLWQSAILMHPITPLQAPPKRDMIYSYMPKRKHSKYGCYQASGALPKVGGTD